MLFGGLLFLLAACQTTKQETAYTGESFGADLEQQSAPVSFTELAARLDEAPQDTIEAKVIASVEAVCQMKGCWMTLVPEPETTADADASMMVRFKDYGFFVPKDIAGRRVIVEGKAYYTTTSVEELRHYAEDAGKSEEEIAAITEPKQELAFLASGVLLIDEPAR
jgi:hypothetical protein